MAEAYVQVAPDSTGAKVRTERLTVGANSVDHQVAILASSDGTLLGLASTSAQTSVSAATASTSLLTASATRYGATVYNDSTAICYLLLNSGTASTSAYTVQIAAGGYYEVPFGYTGAIKAIWAAANGSARITEFSA
jgi:hypothetical protein